MNKTTEQVLTEMLTESTGRHMLDSGGVYGRHWERNRQNGITKGALECDYWSNDEEKSTELIPSIPIFDAFNKTLKYTKKCQEIEQILPYLDLGALTWIEDEIIQGKRWSRLNSLINNRNVGVLHIDLIGAKIQLLGSTLNYANNLMLHLHQTMFEENNYVGSRVWNTYNGEDHLTQGYERIFFQYDGDDYIAISIHNGCDIRGGYTNIHIFELEYGEDEFLDAQYRANIYCECFKNDYMYLESNYYDSFNEQADVDGTYVYKHTYIEDGKLKCKYCHSVLKSEVIDI